LLTRQGAIATAVSVALVVAGRLFAIFELFVVGAGGAALVIGAVAVTGLTRLRLDVARQLRPPRIHAGEPATVTLLVTNGGRRRTPVIQLRDTVGPGRTASVVLSPLAPGEHVTAVYSLPGEHRGRVGLGPLVVRVSDPFGLAALSAPAAPVVELTVWPAVERVMAPSPASGRDHDLGTPAELRPSGDEFYALRPYADGDDFRRVHWRASAKRDDLVVRQDERCSRGQATIVLDTRTGTYGGDTFERAVSAAASIVVAAARRGLILRLVTTAGHDSGMATGSGSSPDPVDAILDHLAVVAPRDVGHLPTVVSTMERAGRDQGDRVVVITGDGRQGEPGVARTTAVSPDAATLVVFTSGAGSADLSATSHIVVVDETTSFASAWNHTMATIAPTARV
jgi:uncharacterized protein (DUF58 family)